MHHPTDRIIHTQPFLHQLGGSDDMINREEGNVLFNDALNTFGSSMASEDDKHVR